MTGVQTCALPICGFVFWFGCSLLSFFFCFFIIFKLFFILITLFYFILSFFLPFLLNHVADRILVLQPGVRPVSLMWESQVQEMVHKEPSGYT